MGQPPERYPKFTSNSFASHFGFRDGQMNSANFPVQQDFNRIQGSGSGSGNNSRINYGNSNTQLNASYTNTNLQQNHTNRVPRGVHEAAVVIYFSGAVKKSSLIGGCGWWLVRGKETIAYGAAPVQQVFPSLVKLEYEGLLNGLQAALKRGMRNVIIRGTSTMVISSCTTPVNTRGFFQTLYSETKGLVEAIQKALKFFNSYRFQLISMEDNAYAIKLADNIIVDTQQYNNMGITKKLKLTNIVTPFSTTTTTTTTTTNNNNNTAAAPAKTTQSNEINALHLSTSSNSSSDKSIGSTASMSTPNSVVTTSPSTTATATNTNNNMMTYKSRITNSGTTSATTASAATACLEMDDLDYSAESHSFFSFMDGTDDITTSYTTANTTSNTAMKKTDLTPIHQKINNLNQHLTTLESKPPSSSLRSSFETEFPSLCQMMLSTNNHTSCPPNSLPPTLSRDTSSPFTLLSDATIEMEWNKTVLSPPSTTTTTSTEYAYNMFTTSPMITNFGYLNISNVKF